MAKKKIGCTQVTNGVARGWFTLPENLQRGVYELLGEYQGNEVYQSSYDVKYLIIGLGTEFQGLEATYQVDEAGRTLVITGRLVGFNDVNEEVGLANEKVYFKVGDYENPLDLTPEERSLDALYLTTVTGETYVTTGNNGAFRFECYVPQKFNDWEYQLYTIFNGNYDYVSCIAQSVLRVGYAPTYTLLEILPSNHLHPESGMLLRASVYLKKDIDSFGNPKEGAERITAGRILFKRSSSGQDGTFYTVNDSYYGDSTPMQPQYLSDNDGWVLHKHLFNKQESDVFQEYIYAKYYGATGYKPSDSIIIHVTVDEYGDKLDPICMQLETLDEEQRTVFYVHGENPDKLLRLNYYCRGSEPVPLGYVIVTADEVE